MDEFYAITSRRSRDYIRALPIRKRRPFTSLFPKATPDAIDFLQRTLVRWVLPWNLRAWLYLFQTFDPKKRLTVDEALDHPYLAAYVSSNKIPCRIRPTTLCTQHDPEDEPVVASLDPDYFDFDRKFLWIFE